MSGIEIRIAVIAGSLVLASPVYSSIEDDGSRENSYKTIVERNPFGLKPPPPPPAPAAVAAPPKSDIKLTGITTFGTRKAYFMTADPKGGGKVDYYSLGVDEKKDGLEVLEIDEVNKSVKIRNGGIETLLTFSTHGIAAPASVPAAPTPTPGVPGVPGAVPPATASASSGPVITPDMIAARNGTGSLTRTIPPRTPRAGQTDANVQYAGGYAQRLGVAQGAANTGLQAVPTPENHLSSEEQVLMLELQRVANPHMQLPPTPGLPSTQNPVPTAPNQPVPGLPGQMSPGLPGSYR